MNRGMGGNWMDDFRGRALPRSCNTRSGTEIISAGEEGWRSETVKWNKSRISTSYVALTQFNSGIHYSMPCKISPGSSISEFHHSNRFSSKSNKNYQLIISLNPMDRNGFRMEFFRFYFPKRNKKYN